MIAGLNGGKMSSSVEGKTSSPVARIPIAYICFYAERYPDSKIDLLDSPEAITKKIRKAEAFPKIIEANGVLALVESILLPAAALKGRKEFIVERSRDGLEPLVYTDIKQLHEDYQNDVVRIILHTLTHYTPLTNHLTVNTAAA